MRHNCNKQWMQCPDCKLRIHESGCTGKRILGMDCQHGYEAIRKISNGQFVGTIVLSDRIVEAKGSVIGKVFVTIALLYFTALIGYALVSKLF